MTRVSKHWRLAMCAAALCLGYAAPRTLGQQAPAAEELVARAANAGLSYDERQSALTAMTELEPSARYAALRDLVAQSTDGFVLNALSILAMEIEATPDSVPLVAAKTAELVGRGADTVLGKLPEKRRLPEPVEEIPRSVLRVMRAANVVPGDPQALHYEEVDLAASLLLESPSQEDKELAQDLLGIRRSSRGLWLLRGEAGGLTPAEVALAESVWQDAALPLPTRFAAALAVAPHDAGAATFVQDMIADTIATFGELSQEELVSGAFSGDAAAKQTFLEVRAYRAPIVGMLGRLRTADAPLLIGQALTTSNSGLRVPAGLVAARQFPQLLLDRGQGAFSAQEYHALLAIVAEEHPQLESAASAAAGEATLTEERATYRQHGWTARLGPVSIDGR